MENIKRWNRNIYTLDLVRNYYNQKVLNDNLTLGERKYAAKECADQLNNSKQLELKFIGTDILRLLNEGYFYKSNLVEVYRTLQYTTNKYKAWKETYNG